MRSHSLFALFMLPSLAVAQVDEVIVTGTRIQGMSQENMASPVEVIDDEALDQIGATRIADLVNNLTINNGAQNNPDAFTQNFTRGSENINLRGLGVGATLTLLNGQRQVVNAFPTNEGETFVDTASLLPTIAIQRVEILKDGAASIYGSDAVAGVVNFISHEDFVGAEYLVDYRTSGDHDETELGGLWGFDFNENTNIMLAASFLNRSSLTMGERRYARLEDQSTIAGNPPTFILSSDLDGGPGGSPTSDLFLADPSCAEVATLADDITVRQLPAGNSQCLFDFRNDYDLVSSEERFTGMLAFNSQLTDTTALNITLNKASNDADSNSTASFPIPFPLVLANPNSPAVGAGLAIGSPFVPAPAELNLPAGADPIYGTGLAPIVVLGRSIGALSGPASTVVDSDTDRLAIDLEGAISTWDWNLNMVQARSDISFSYRDTVQARYIAALSGFGGPDCNPADGPGTANCLFFNPFGSALLPDGDAASNAELIPFINERVVLTTQSELSTFEFNVSTALFEMSGGDAGLAMGVQARREQLDFDASDIANQPGGLFFTGQQIDFNAEREVFAIFAEMVLPVTDRFTAQLAMRYEDYDSGFDSVDPKIALLFRPIDDLSLRGSFSTSFRAPSLYQQQGTQTNVEEVVFRPSLPGQPAALSFIPIIAQPNPDLDAEEATIFNIGATWQPTDLLTLNLDYWSFDYDDKIVQLDAQSLAQRFFDNLADNTQPGLPDGTSAVFNNNILQVLNTTYENASELQTSGLDVGVLLQGNLTDSAIWAVDLKATYVLEYDLTDPLLGSIDGVGNRNAENFGTSVPEWRGNIGVNLLGVQHAFNTYFRFVNSYEDDENNNAEIDSHFTIDWQYAYTLNPLGEALEGISLRVGMINAFDEDPPYVSTLGGYDSKVHDPRGRMTYVSAEIPF